MRSTVVVAALFLLAACGTTGSQASGFQPVSPADFGRLGPTELGPVDQARREAADARDRVARLDLELQEAHHEADYARADETAAQADAERAQAEISRAKEAGDQAWLSRANAMADAAHLRRQAAEAHLAYARKLVAAQQANVTAAQKAVDLADAKIEQAKLVALQQAGVPAASKYDPARFSQHVANARKDVDEARAQADQTEREALAAQRTWRSLQQSWQARAEALRGQG